MKNVNIEMACDRLEEEVLLLKVQMKLRLDAAAAAAAAASQKAAAANGSSTTGSHGADNAVEASVLAPGAAAEAGAEAEAGAGAAMEAAGAAAASEAVAPDANGEVAMEH